MSYQKEQIGPLEDAAMLEAIATGLLSADSFVLRAGSSEWSRARDFPELLVNVTVKKPVTSIFPWSAKVVVNVDGTWGSEVRFPNASANEVQAISAMLRQYAVIQSSQLPKVSVTVDGGGVVFLFPPTLEKVEEVPVNTPLGDDEVEELRLTLLRVADILHRNGMGIWAVDRRLLFHSGKRYLMIPPIWLPAFAGRSGNLLGAAPEWRDTGSQPQADMYAVACVCFATLTGEEYNPYTSLSTEDVPPLLKAWDTVLRPALQQLPSRRPASIEGWLAIQPSTLVTDVIEVEVEEQSPNQKNLEIYVKIPMNVDQINEIRKKSSATVSRISIMLSRLLKHGKSKTSDLISGAISANRNIHEIDTVAASDSHIRQDDSVDMTSKYKAKRHASRKKQKNRKLTVSAAALLLIAAISISGNISYLLDNSVHDSGITSNSTEQSDHNAPRRRYPTFSGTATYNFWMKGNEIFKECQDLLQMMNQQGGDPYGNGLVAMLALGGVITSLDNMSTEEVDPRAANCMRNIRVLCVAIYNLGLEASKIQRMYGANIPDAEQVKIGIGILAIIAQCAVVVQERNKTAQSLSSDYGINFP